MSTTVVQYAPDSSIASVFHKYGFAYKLDNQNGIVVTTMNRIRIYLDILGVPRSSKKLIIALLEEINGIVLGGAVNTYGHISKICLLNIDQFRERVRKAIENGEVQTQ